MRSVSVLGALALALVWCLVVGDFGRGQMIVGLVFGAGYVLATGTGRGTRVPLPELPRRLAFMLLHLFVLLPYDLVRSNVRLAGRILHPRLSIRPGIVRIPLGEEVSRATVALEEHAITLTPGQMVVDYSADENLAYIHVVDVDEVELLQRTIWRRYRTVLDRVVT
jgi:multisubunit Na+/H+ antiporter MnhE subunit